MLIPYYVVANQNRDGMIPMIFVMAVMLWSFEQCSLFLALLFANPLIGMLMSVGLWFVNFLFCGAFLKPEFVSEPFRIFCDIFPLGWTLKSIQYLCFHGTVWEGAVDQGNNVVVCADYASSECFGRTGDQVLDNLSFIFPVSSENTIGTDWVFVFLYGV